MRNTQSNSRRIFWLQHLEAQRQSGKTITAYCKEQNVSADRFWYWKKVLLNASGTQTKPTFLPIEIVDAPKSINVQQERKALPDPKWLAEFILAIGNACRVNQ